MKIQITSDLHLDFFYTLEEQIALVERLAKTEPDILVIAGDLARADKTYHKDIFKVISDNFNETVFVPGNHDYYLSTVDEANRRMREEADKYKNFHILMNDTVSIGNQRFVGTTLWFSSNYAESDIGMMNDFRVIYDLPEKGRSLSPQTTSFLSQEVDSNDIVVTHHLPTPEVEPREFRDTRLSQFFVNDVGTLIAERQPKIWIFGHTHTSVEATIGKTRLLCNPYGYFGVAENTRFNYHLVVEV